MIQEDNSIYPGTILQLPLKIGANFRVKYEISNIFTAAIPFKGYFK